MNTKYLAVSVEVEIPDSADTDAEYGHGISLYGHSEVVASFKVLFALKPCAGRNFHNAQYAEWEREPMLECEGVTTFWQDSGGGDHEREYELDSEQYDFAVKEAIKQAKSKVNSVRFEERA